MKIWSKKGDRPNRVSLAQFGKPGKRTYDVEWVVKASHAIPELLDEVELANKLLGAETITDANSVITSMWAERSHMNEQINKLQAEVERLQYCSRCGYKEGDK